MVVLWAYPHCQDELTMYGQYILSQFLTSISIPLNIEYDQATQKFFHGHQDLSFTDIDKIAFLANQIFLL